MHERNGNDGISRREILLAPGALASGVAAAPPPAASEPWYRGIQRCGQTNMNERDLIGFDVEGWADYWASLKLDVVLLNGGGIVAYYPTKVPFHHRSQFLGARDVLGEFIAAVKKRGIRVMARMDPNFAYEDALKARPEWFQRTQSGQPMTDPQSTWLYRTCLFGPWFTEQMPAIYREVNSLYDVDGFFTNGFPQGSAPSLCYCATCQKMYQRLGGVPAREHPSDLNYRKFFEAHQERVIEIWKLWEKTVREKKPDSVFAGNIHNNLQTVKNIKKIAEAANWFNVDGQDRGGGPNPLWHCGQQTRVSQSVMRGKTVSNATGAYASSSYAIWRHTSKSPEEATLWLAASAAGGTAPVYHWLGAQPVDNRWREAGRSFYEWTARHSRHFRNRRSLADVAMVYSQRTLCYYAGAGARGERTDHFQGMYYSLLQTRLPFDFVHEDDLGPETLRRYRALLLPNVALLGDTQCAQLREYARGGGSLLATFETSLYNEWGDPRPEFGIGEALGIRKAGATQGPLGNSYARVEQEGHELLNGIGPTALLPGAVYRVPVRALGGGAPVLTYVPPYPSHPPEMVYPRVARTDEPAVVLGGAGGGRTLYFPGDIERCAWRTSNTDLDLLLQNAIRWVRGASAAPVEVEGDGVLDLFCWETEPGYAVHLLNYTNPHMLAGWVRRFYPVGRQQVRVRVPEGVRIANVHALRADRKLPFRREGGTIRFEVPQVVDYEVAALVRG